MTTPRLRLSAFVVAAILALPGCDKLGSSDAVAMPKDFPSDVHLPMAAHAVRAVVELDSLEVPGQAAPPHQSKVLLHTDASVDALVAEYEGAMPVSGWTRLSKGTKADAAFLVFVKRDSGRQAQVEMHAADEGGTNLTLTAVDPVAGAPTAANTPIPHVVQDPPAAVPASTSGPRETARDPEPANDGQAKSGAPADGTTAEPPAANVAPLPALAAADDYVLLSKAKAAQQDKRIFAPPGDNAIYYYLQFRDRHPDSEEARAALTDLFPYAMIAAERATDPGEADRLLGMLERIDRNAPSLPRLREELQRRQSGNR